jgi:hypothetical protein
MYDYATEDVKRPLVEDVFLLPFCLLQTQEPHDFEVLFRKIFLQFEMSLHVANLPRIPPPSRFAKTSLKGILLERDEHRYFPEG